MKPYRSALELMVLKSQTTKDARYPYISLQKKGPDKDMAKRLKDHTMEMKY
jgi:hypothetical protein